MSGKKPLYCFKDTSFIFGTERFNFKKGVVQRVPEYLYNHLKEHPNFVNPTDLKMLDKKFPEPVVPLRIGIMRNGGYGDILMGTAIVKAIRNKHPDAFLTWYTTPQFAILLRRFPVVNSIRVVNWYVSEYDYFKRNVSDFDIFYCIKPDGEVWSTNPTIKEKFPIINKLRKVYDKYYKNNNSYEWLKKCKMRWDEVCKVTLDLDVDEKNMWFNLKPACDKRISDAKHAIIVPDGAGGIQTKSWITAHWVKVIDYLHNLNFEVYQLGDRHMNVIPKTISYIGKTNLEEAVGYVKNCDLFVGCDGFMSHIAALYNVCNVCVFGPTPSNMWGHRNLNVIESDYNCPHRPCWSNAKAWHNNCIVNNKLLGECMLQLHPNIVIDKIREVLNDTTRTHDKRPSYQCSGSV